MGLGLKQDSSTEGTGQHAVNTATFEDAARKELMDALDEVYSRKDIVLDPQLVGPLNRITDIQFFKDHGVGKVHYLDEHTVETESNVLIYICRPKMIYMQYIADHIKKYEREGKSMIYKIFMVPRITLVCQQILEQEGVLGSVELDDCAIDMIPLDTDLLSLELKDTFKGLYIDGDYSSLYNVARAVMRLQTEYGFFPRILGKGDMAKVLTDILLQMRRELATQNEVVKEGASLSVVVDSLVIIDRSIDLVSPLCTQLTYAGLVDEHYGIEDGYIKLDMHAKGAPVASTSSSASPLSSPTTTSGSRKKKVQLDARDNLYSIIRDLNFSAATAELQQFAKRLQEGQEKRHNMQSINQIREMAGRLNELQADKQSLTTHVTIIENIQKWIDTDGFRDYLEAQQGLLDGQDTNIHNALVEELINQQAPIEHVLRLLCLQSLVNNGLKVKQYDYFRQEIVQTYGYEHMLTLQRLVKAGLLVAQGSGRNHYPTLRKQLRLSVPDVDEHQPTDIAYVYSGYAPLSVRLVQCASRVPSRGLAGISGWRGYEDTLRLIKGETVDEAQRVDDGISQQWTKRANKERTTVVLFLGGCTFTEVAALRFHAQKEQVGRHYLILTTEMLDGKRLMHSLIERPQNK
ncbi:vacuolar protein sorting-associated protein 33A [Syncephalis fuscata]|nr:vacuolar protein sorting-associated protein 33A [Syncephalis fuscata]